MASCVSPHNRWSHFTLVCEWNESPAIPSPLASALCQRSFWSSQAALKWSSVQVFYSESVPDNSPPLSPFSVSLWKAAEPRVQSLSARWDERRSWGITFTGPDCPVCRAARNTSEGEADISMCRGWPGRAAEGWERAAEKPEVLCR